MRILTLVMCLLTLSIAHAHAQCLGDFNGDGKVTVDELVTAVDNALHGCQISGPRFVDNGDGTVTDRKTGLQWEKKDNADGIINDADLHDADNTYGWSIMEPLPSSDTLPDGTAFTTFLGALNNGLLTFGEAGFAITGCFAGHCDWRLPSLFELEGIVDPTAPDCGSGGSCIDPVFGPTQPTLYWTATSNSDAPPKPHFSSTFRVRC